MKSHHDRWIAAVAAVLLSAAPLFGASLSALASFGGGDGWLSPAEATYLQGGPLQRGLTYNQATNRLYLVDRNGGNFVRVLDGDTGALVSSLDMTGVTGGTFAVNMIDVADDGAIYVGNLSTSAAANFKVYRWANESAAPTVAFDGLANRVRVGDTLAVTGSGANTKIVAAGGSTAGEAYALFSTADGLSFTVSNPVATGAANGAFRLGIDFAAGGTVLGKQPTSSLTSVAQAGGTVATFAMTANGEAPIAFDQVGNWLASVDVNSNTVRLYDGSDLSLLSTTGLLDSRSNTTGTPVANGNGVGDLKFGRTGGQVRLYALNAGNGIQAFTVIPEPASVALWGAACGVIALVRRRQVPA